MALLVSLAVGLLSLVLPRAALAAGPWCQFVPCVGGGGVAGLNGWLQTLGMELVVMIGGLVAAYVLYTAFVMIIESSGEGASKGKQSLKAIIVGCAVVAMATSLQISFGLSSTGTGTIDSELGKIVMFFQGVLFAALVANIVLQGYRYITSQGESGQMDKARQRLFASFIGTGIVILAFIIVQVAMGDAGTAVVQAVGIANYLITIFGGLAVIAVLISGILLVVSIDEGLKEKSKAALKVALISIVVVILSAAIVRFFAATVA
jgi:hypothetical protein